MADAPSAIIMDEEVEEFERLLTRMVWQQRRRMGRALVSSGLTMPRFLALASIHERGDWCSMGELADATEQCSATMTGIVDRLLRMGLVRRKRDPNDRRSVLVGLTDSGETLVEHARHQHRERAKQMLAHFSPQERADILRLLNRYVEILQAEPVEES